MSISVSVVPLKHVHLDPYPTQKKNRDDIFRLLNVVFEWKISIGQVFDVNGFKHIDQAIDQSTC